MGKRAIFIQRIIKKINIGYAWGILKKINKWSKEYFKTKPTKGMGNYER